MSYGRQYRINRARVLAASTVCYICGHNGADAADHVLAKARGGDDSVTNLQPVHHKPCETCGAFCNLAKGKRLYAPIVRRSSSIEW